MSTPQDYAVFQVGAAQYPLALPPGTTWSSGLAVALGDHTAPTAPNGYVFEVTNAGSGTTGAAEPTWPTTIGDATTADSHGVVWKNVGPASTQSLLQVADPFVFYFLDFLTFVINQYCGAALKAALKAAGLKTPAGAPMQAVAQAYPYEPLPEYLENQIAFPALFVWRKDLKTEWHSVGLEVDVASLEVAYVLPPLDAAAAERLLPILTAVSKALRRKATDAWDPAYTPPGGTLGDQYTAAPYAHVMEAGFGEYVDSSDQRMGAHGYLEGTEGLYFPCLKLLAYVAERDNYDPTQGGPSKFAGGDITGNLKADDGTVVAPFVQVSTQEAPAVASLGTSTGTHLGGTSVGVVGTLFRAGAVVYFGPASNPQYATSVTWNSSTSLTVTSPAVSGAGVVDVTVVNPDGQSGTLPQSFTYT